MLQQRHNTVQYHVEAGKVTYMYVHIMLPGYPGDVWGGIHLILNTGTGDIPYSITSGMDYLSSPNKDSQWRRRNWVF